MSRWRRPQRDVPGLNLASLPDLIFTVLFFFMIVTHMRDVEPKVRFTVPQGTELEKTRKAGVIYLFIGRPVDGQGNTTSSEPLIQLNDHYVSIDQIAPAVQRAREAMGDDDRQHLTVSIRADRDVEMGLINDVKQALRKAGALNISYSATKE